MDKYKSEWMADDLDIDDDIWTDSPFGVGEGLGGGASRGGPMFDLQDWIQTPSVLAWFKAQGPGFGNLIESIGQVAPDNWEAAAKPYFVQTNYIKKRWPDGWATLHAAVWDHGQG